MSDQRLTPFYCGSQFGDWEESNCERCAKQGECEIELALQAAYWGDGAVSADTAAAMGYDPNNGAYVWMCASVEWAEWWKAEKKASEK